MRDRLPLSVERVGLVVETVSVLGRVPTSEELRTGVVYVSVVVVSAHTVASEGTLVVLSDWRSCKKRVKRGSTFEGIAEVADENCVRCSLGNA